MVTIRARLAGFLALVATGCSLGGLTGGAGDASSDAADASVGDSSRDASDAPAGDAEASAGDADASPRDADASATDADGSAGDADDADGSAGDADASARDADAGDATLRDGTASDAPPGDAASDSTSACAPDASFLTDPNNCGACGHGCLGAACNDGACEPFTLAPTLGGSPFQYANTLAMDEATLYLVDDDTNSGNQGSVYAISKPPIGACAVAFCYPIALWTGYAPANVATNADTVFVATFNGTETGGSIYAVDKNGGGASVFASGYYFSWAITTDADAVYWTNFGVSFSQGSVVRQLFDAGSADAGGEVLAMTLTNANSLLTAIAVDATEVYWLEEVAGGPLLVNAKGTPGSGGTFATSGNEIPTALIVSGANVLWTEQLQDDGGGGGGVNRAGTNGGCPEAPCPLVTGLTNATGLAADATYVYIATAGTNATHSDGKVLRIRQDGTCAGATCPEVLATGQLSPSSILVDDTAIYWVNRGTTPDLINYPNHDGSLQVLAK